MKTRPKRRVFLCVNLRITDEPNAFSIPRDVPLCALDLLTLSLYRCGRIGECMRSLILSIVIWLLAMPTFASQSVPVDTGKVTASLVSSHDSVAPGQEFYIALRTVLDDHWHTYWRNPGDSGEPVQMEWDLSDGVSAGEINWPLPSTIPTGPIINYGFEGAPLFPVKFTISPDAALGSVITVRSNFYYLVCKDVCIPEQGSANLPIACLLYTSPSPRDRG